MSNLNIIISMIVGIVGFLFLVWRRLKEDYGSDEIFSFGFITAISLVVGFLIGIFLQNKLPASAIFKPSGIWFWLGFISMSLGFSLSVYKFKLKVFESLEGAAVGFIFWFFAICLVNSIQTLNLKLLILSLISGSLIPLFLFLNSKYKSFNWYKSGKIGFAGLVVLALFFIIRSVVALINPTMLSFIGKSDAVLSILVSFAFFVTLYKLSNV